MNYRAIVLHDEAMEIMPEGARHDSDLCPVCTQWELAEDGLPKGYQSLEGERKIKPYGEVEYADDGVREDGVCRYPIGSKQHAERSLELLSIQENAERYTEQQLSKVMASVKEAVSLYEEEESKPPRDTDLAEGGKVNAMDTIAKETHEALLAKAVQDATDSANEKIASLTESVESLTSERDGLKSEVDTLKEDNARLNTELDTAQVKLKTSDDEIASLKDEIEQRDEKAKLDKVASDRAEQVKNLSLFTDEYVQDKASRWAELSDEDWADRIEEWKQAKASEGSTSATDDIDSAMSGSSETESANPPSARKRVLGLA